MHNYMDYHELLYRTRWLMTEVEAARSNLAGHLQTEDSLLNEMRSAGLDLADVLENWNPDEKLRLEDFL